VRRLRYDGTDTFRHELASVLFLDGPMSGLLSEAHDADLVRYLVLAHHGKLRVQIRDSKPAAEGVLGLKEGAEIAVPAVLGQPDNVMRTSLARISLHGDPDANIPGWADLVSDLLNRYGAFRLAYLETLVRVADWRASARHDNDGRTQ
jgi:CRISPR-associated endonuclease/helicase Cas3